jgi:hypothetical protein
MEYVVLKFIVLISILSTTTADLSPDGTGIYDMYFLHCLLWCTLPILHIPYYIHNECCI